MKPVFHALSILACLCALNGCRTTPGKPGTNVGPFDSHGNYVDAWADDPSKWRAYTPKDTGGELPKIAKNEQPPENSVPLAAGGSTTTRTTRTTVVTSAPAVPDSARVVARTSVSKTKGDTGRSVAKTSASKSKGDSEHSMAKTSASKSKGDSEHSLAKTTSTKPKSKPKSDSDSEATAKSTAKSKSSTAKAKPKTSGTHHTVKAGDSLASIAAKYGTSVSALKAANGISGTTIRDGRTLVIPAHK